MPRTIPTTIIALLLLTALAPAANIFQTFAEDPTDHHWSSSPAGASTFTFNPAGYLEATIYRDPANLARYSVPLPNPIDHTAEFWWEMDCQLLNASTHSYGMALTGLFDAASPAALAFRFASPSSSNRYDLWRQTPAATYSYWLGPTPIPNDAPVRVRGHYWPSAGAGYADITVIDLLTGQPIGATGPHQVIPPGQACSFSHFGLGNRNDNYATGPTRCLIDNLYFSTDAPNPDPQLPSFLGAASVAVTATADSLTLRTSLANYSAAPLNLRVRHRLYPDENPASAPFLELLSDPLTIPAGQALEHDAAASALAPNLWSPEHPNLYLLRTEILDAASAPVNRIDTTIGFRTFEIVGKHFHLNGQPVYLRSFHMTPPGRIPPEIHEDPTFIQTHIDRLLSYNVNFLRLGEGASQAWFNACDRAGIMVMAGCYGGTGTSDTSIWQKNLARLETEIPRVRNHPSVVIWYIGNEWVLTASGMKQAAADLYYAVREIDPSRPLFNTWTAKYFDGDLIASTGSDFLDYHNYAGWYSSTVFDFYGYKTGHQYPTTLTECVGAYTSYDPDFSAFCLKGGVEDKYRANVLRHIGHSYDLHRDSLDYQAWLTRNLTELCRRGRGPDSSFCGAMPFTYGYSYACYEDPGNIAEYPKPVMDDLALVLRPLHVVISQAHPHAFPGDSLPVRLEVLNDDRANYFPQLPASQLHVSLAPNGGDPVYSTVLDVPAVPYYDSWDYLLNLPVPADAPRGDYLITAELRLDGQAVVTTTDPAFVAPESWCTAADLPGLVALYDPAGITADELAAAGISTTPLQNWSHLPYYSALIIGKNAFNSTVFSRQADVAAFIAAGKRVLILEQDDTTVKSAINANSWLGTNLQLSVPAGEEFVNLERPHLDTLMQGLDRRDFRTWNRNNSSANQDRTLFSRYYSFDKSDLDRVAILANAGQHLIKPVLIEIFPNARSGGSCILSQLRLVDRHRPDPKAARFLANLLDYLREPATHYQHVLVNREIRFGDFASERGLFPAPLQQGMHYGYTGLPYEVPGHGRDFRGVMRIKSGLGYVEEDDPADREICPVYLRTGFDLGRTPIAAVVHNKYSSPLGYRLIFNGQQLPWTIVPPGQTITTSFNLPTVIPADSDVKLEFDAEEGSHTHGYSTGLLFLNLQLAPPADLNYDNQVNISDLQTLTRSWLTGSLNTDLNLDNKTNLLDYTILAESW